MLQLLGKFGMWLFGFKTVTPLITAKRCVVIATPHTSNWDSFMMICIGYAERMHFKFLIKKKFTDGFFAWPLRKFGAIGIDRGKRHDYVKIFAEELKAYSDLKLAIAAEGTRSKRTHWKSGFYHIAKAANLPYVIAVMDWKRREIRYSDPLHPTDDIRADMDKIREFVKGAEGRCHKNFTEPLLREEDQLAETRKTSKKTA